MNQITDVIVIGAGPIGIETTANLLAANLSCLLFDSGCLGETITKWPQGATFFSSPERCAIAGIPIQTTHQSMLNGEEYLSYLRQVVEIRSIPLKLFHPVSSIEKKDTLFEVVCTRPNGEKKFKSRFVVLATGNMARSRKLSVPGENLAHVAHTLSTPHRYFKQKLLIIGGRNSAVESAIRCWRAGADVTISYRGKTFEKQKLNSRYHLEISILTKKGKIGFLPESQVKRIEHDKVVLQGANGRFNHTCEFVLVQAGFEADLNLMHQLGVAFDGNENIPVLNLQTMETSVPGLFLAGTAAGGGRASYKIFVATSHHHGQAITRCITGQPGKYAGSLPARSYQFDNADIAPTEGGSPGTYSSPAEPLPEFFNRKNTD